MPPTEQATENSAGGTVCCGAMTLLPNRMEATLDGAELNLTTREFQLLRYLAENSGTVCTREDIFRSVWGTDFGDIQTVTVTIKKLRGKLGSHGGAIKTVWGSGYLFVPPKSKST